MPYPPRLRAMRAILQDRIVPKAPSGDGHREHHAIIGSTGRLVEQAEALHDLLTTRDPTQTDAAHTKKGQLAVVEYAKKTEVELGRMNKSWAEGMDRIHRAIAAKLNLKLDAYAPEVRDLYRRLSSAEKAKFLTELVNEGRGSELAAIVKAPKALTGMPDEQRGRYEAAFTSRHAPEEVREQEELDEAFKAALVVEREARGLAAAYSDPAKLEEITRAENAAAAAQARFDGKVQS